MKKHPALWSCLAFAVSLVAARAATASSFKPDPAWQGVESVALAADGKQLTGGGQGDVLFYAGPDATKRQLQTPTYFGDSIVKFEFMLGADTIAAIYLEGRYGVDLSANGMGTALAGLSREKTAEPAVPPLVKAAAAAGAWQTFEVSYRIPRFDDARNTTQHALILEVKINGLVVQSNCIRTDVSAGTEMDWEDAGGPLSIGVKRGSFALRNFSNHRADFGAVKLPAITGQPTNTAKLVDLVKRGDELFHALGCAECHATQKGDDSAKTGPNQFGLFTLEPRDRAIVSGGEGHRFTVKTDFAYLQRSLRTPAEEVAIAESGPKTGEPYLPAMPTFLPEVISDPQIQAIFAYLGTLNDLPQQAPVVKLAEETGVKNYDPVADRLQLLVDDRVVIQRGPMEHVSGRSIHVGQPNGANYTFDPRLLAVVQVWQGGFLDMTGEFTNRGGQGLKKGYQSREIDLGASPTLLAPLDAKGAPIDFTFKDAIFRDKVAIAESLNSPRDHLDRLAAIDAQFLGYSRDSTNPAGVPTFNYRVGRNTISLRTEIAADGRTRLVISGPLTEAQAFSINEKALGAIKVSAGEIKDGKWTLPAGLKSEAVAEGRLMVVPNAWRPSAAKFGFSHQPLVVEPAKPNLPKGYRAETYLGPKDNYGRDMLFEALGLAVAPDGTLVVATRTAGIWRLGQGEWRLFAEGLFDSLGVQVEDDHGFKVVAGQKAELTRISDTNGDGLADSYETLSDAFSFHGNYHSYMHGPARAPDGSYFITLNLDDAGQLDYEYRAGGKYMGTAGGFRGWAVHVPKDGGFEPWANGLRSPAGIGFGPDGRLWYTENQGEYNGTSKLYAVEKGKFYGHPAGLVDLPGMGPNSPEIAWEKVSARRERPALLFPQSRLANSPGSPVWDTTTGKFGPFAGQMFVGDQTQSVIVRVITERVGDFEQGVAIPFATNLASGVMRMVFLPDNSMVVGQTGRGWQAKGGKVASLQHIVWDGATVPPAMHHVSAVAGGFDVVFTVPLPAGATNEALAKLLKVQSWVYRDAPDYGSDELDDHAEEISRLTLSDDRKTLHVALAKTEQPVLHPQQTARVYRLTLDAKTLWGEDVGPGFDAFYTLYRFPEAK